MKNLLLNNTYLHRNIFINITILAKQYNVKICYNYKHQGYGGELGLERDQNIIQNFFRNHILKEIDTRKKLLRRLS